MALFGVLLDFIATFKISYDHYWDARFVIALLVIALAIYTVIRFSQAGARTGWWSISLIVFWTIVPPVWFFIEYFAFDHGVIVDAAGKAVGQLDSVKTYADYASKIWAAVLAAVLFLYKKK